MAEQSRRHRDKQRYDLRRLRRKMLFQLIGILILTFVIGAVICTVLVDDLLQYPFSEFVVSAVQGFSGMSRDEAIEVYAVIFRQNKTEWLLLMGGIIFLILFWQFTRWFSRYFQMVDQKLDELLQEEGRTGPDLPRELDFIQEKLEQIKGTLERRRWQAQESEQRKNDLVVYLAHDIKTPLTSVIGYLSLLEEAPDMPAAQRAKYTHITLDKAFRLEELINQFFEITRFSLQQIVLEKEPVRLDVMLAQLADEFYPILEPEGKEVQLQVEEGLILMADPDKLARVFNNVLKNAAAYSFPHTPIEILGEREEGQVHITIRNQGHPIPSHQLETIFEKFYRLDGARSTNRGGAGLGLAIAKEIVTAHGGTISAQSDSRYTAFTISLPEYSSGDQSETNEEP